MIGRRDNSVLRYLRYLVQAKLKPLESDAVYLERFAATREEAAFTALMKRHGPMVWAVCRRLVARTEDAEDAFQATFLVLARKAGSIRYPDRLGNWLYGVACRTAAKARVGAAVLATREQPLTAEPAVETVDEALWRDVCSILDEEVQQLPGCYRTTFVLCYLEGLSQKEAAKQLHCPEGTIRSRLSWARERLRTRLARRGLTLSAGAVMDTLLQHTAPAAMPPGLPRVATQAAIGFAAGAACSASSSATTLAEGVLLGMLATKWKLAALVVLLASLTAWGTHALGYSALSGRSIEQHSAPTQQGTSATPPERDQPSERALTTRVDSDGDALPSGALFRFGTARYRHGDGINSDCLYHDGKLLATTGKSSVAIWDLATGRCLHRFHECGVSDGYYGTKVAFSPNGRLVAHVCGWDVAAKIWDVQTGKLLRTVGTRPPKPADWPPLVRTDAAESIAWVPASGPDVDGIFGIRFTADGKELHLIGGSIISVFEPETGKRLRRFGVPTGPKTFSPDGRQFAALPNKQGDGPTKTLVVHAADTGKAIQRLQIPVATSDHWSFQCAFSPDGRSLATTDDGTEVHIWELASRKERCAFRLPADDAQVQNRGFSKLEFSADGVVLFAGTFDHGIRRYDLKRGVELSPLQSHLSQINGLHCMRDGKTLISTSLDGTIRRWELPAGKEIPVPVGYAWGASGTRSPDGALVAAADRSGRLDIWNAATGSHVRTLQTSGDPIFRLAFLPDGKTLAAGCLDGMVRLWDPRTGGQKAHWQRGPVERGWITELAFSSDGSRCATGILDQGLSVWDVRTGKRLWSVPAEEKAAFSPDGEWLVSGGGMPNLSFHDMLTGEKRFQIAMPEDVNNRNHGRYVHAIAFAPTGKVLATAHQDGTIRLWNPAGRNLLGQLPRHETAIVSVHFSVDGKRIASGDRNGIVRIWEVGTGREILRLPDHDGWVNGVEFGTDPQTLLATCRTGSILWDLRAARLR